MAKRGFGSDKYPAEVALQAQQEGGRKSPSNFRYNRALAVKAGKRSHLVRSGVI